MSLYRRVADLSLTIEHYALEGLSQDTPAGWTRLTTVVRLQGQGCDGAGEDVTYDADAQRAFQQGGPDLALAGTYTLDEFSHRLDGLLFRDSTPEESKGQLFRRWAFESAALDLVLQQNGMSLAQALGREARPVRFVVSPSLGDPPSRARLDALWKSYPGTGLKLDASPQWTPEFVEMLAATGLVTTVDLKGQYHGRFSGTAPDPDMYRLVAGGLPDAWIEDPGWMDETRAALEPHLDRVTYDAPICAVADIMHLSHLPRGMNIKPSRIGFLSELLRMYEYCEARGIAMYGGGQFELGPGRAQVQMLASLFHPDGPNDVAPSGFNEHDLASDLPASPLAPPGETPGFH